MNERALTALGFAQRDDGVLVVPAAAVVTFTPIGGFYELRISLNELL